MSKNSMISRLRSNPSPMIPKDRFPQLSEDVLSVINYFLRHKSITCCERTIYDYFLFLPRCLTQFNVTSITEITPDDVGHWIEAHLLDKAQWTKRNYIKQLTVFFDFCQKRGFITKSPILRRMKVKSPQPFSRNISLEEHSKVKKEAEKLPLQERVLVELLDSSAARRGEIFDLKVRDFDLEHCRIPVIGKGGIPGMLYFSKECSYLLQDLIRERDSPNDYIFLSQTGKKLYGKAVWKITSALGKKAGVNGSFHPHRIRHTRATLNVFRGESLENVRRKLRHKLISTTLIYVNILPEDLKRYYERAMNHYEQV